MNDINLLNFAIDGNADECFSIIDSMYLNLDSFNLLNSKYTEGVLDDSEYCNSIVKLLTL